MRMSILFVLMIAGCSQVQPQAVSVEPAAPTRLDLTPEPDPIASQPEATIRIVADPLPVSSSAACPMDASALIDVVEGANHFTGSGTCVSSTDGRSLIITCAHTWKGVNNPLISVTHEKKAYPAKLLREDKTVDLALLEVEADLPAVDIASSQPPVGTTITSVGAAINGQSLVEKEHRVSRILSDAKPPCFQTDGTLQWSGRSGGGAFHNGKLCGTVIGYRNDSRESLYTTVDQIKAFMPVAASGGGVRLKAIAYTGEDVYGKGWCINCGPAHEKFGDGNSIVDLEWSTAVAKGPQIYPAYRFIGTDGKERYPADKRNNYRTIESLDDLAEVMRRAGCEPGGNSPVSSGPVGATIQGRSIIDSAFATIEKYAGRSASFKVLWKNTDGKKVLPIGQEIDFDEIRGTSGRVEFSCDAATVPLKQLSFDYQFVNGKIRFKLTGEAEVDAPADGVVSSSGPVGDPLTVLYTVFSVAKTIWELCHPTISFVLPETLEARSSFTGDELTIDCDGTGPALRLNWRLFWGLLRWEMNRPLTGLSISRERVELQFHRSKWYRDVVVEVN